jgi:hypothetical protein
LDDLSMTPDTKSVKDFFTLLLLQRNTAGHP